MLKHVILDADWHSPASSIARAMKRGLWYLNRLYCMTPAEMCHRTARAVAMRAERRGLAAFPVVPPPTITDARPWIRAPAQVDAGPCLKAADRIASGRFDIFALRSVELGNPPRWNRDPKTGVEAPLHFGKLLDYRDARLVGDIKYLWEPNRHAHLVTLAQAYAVSGEARYFDVIREHLQSWIAACPYGRGANWSSALEVALRLISWSAAWQLLGGAGSPLFMDSACMSFRERWLQSVFQHARFVYGHFSRYSSANNHLIGEAAGLFIAALTWPCWPQARVWQRVAKDILEREILLQNSPDGVNLEQAVSYQRFVLELLLLCWLAARANGEEFSPVFRSRLEAMLEYLASIMDVEGNVAMIGDADDAGVLQLDHRPEFCGYRSVLATGALLFHRGDFGKKAGVLDDRTRWLIDDADATFGSLDTSHARLPVRQAFPEGGYYILGCDFETPDEIRLIADAGPLGYQTIAAHGHADALGFWLSVGGAEFFIDPGTYAYHTQEAWRVYFRGTAAHNTVRIDGVDQSRSGGNFMWVRKARAGCTLWSSESDRDAFEGWHDGYLRLDDPVLHRRRITLDKQARRIAIEDILEMKGTHTIELFFHCSERCRVEQTPPGYTIRHGSTLVRLTPPQMEEAEQSVYCGSVAPILGWVSRRFDERQPTSTVVWRCRVTGAAVLRSEISCSAAGAATSTIT
ncbi:MAG: alginate lyase family protein [Betaproteobacteria bacterium]|nr:alginate lyase family protein [Betaproteobacteria bacterium]